MEPQQAEYICPSCSQTVQVMLGEHAQLWTCPHCGGGFVIAGMDGSTDLSDERASGADAAPADEELNNVRIRQLMQARISANRRRAFSQFGAAACVIGMVAATISMIGGPVGRWTFAYVLLDLLLLFVAVYLFRRAREFAAEAERSKLPEPTAPPDFSTLGDGSDRWKKLEKLR